MPAFDTSIRDRAIKERQERLEQERSDLVTSDVEDELVECFEHGGGVLAIIGEALHLLGLLQHGVGHPVFFGGILGGRHLQPGIAELQGDQRHLTGSRW